MSDTDTLIRKAVVEIVEAAPAAPAFEDLAPPAEVAPGSHRDRRPVFAAAAAVVLVVALGLGVWAASRPDGSGRVRTSSAARPRDAAPPPPAVTGTEQHIVPVQMPAEFTSVLGRRSSMLVEGTTPMAYTVEDTSPFAIAEVNLFRNSPTSTRPYLQLMTNGTLSTGGQGLGIQMSGPTMDDVRAGTPATFAAWDFPVPGQRLDAWSRLPDGTAYVTMDYGTAGRLWERPANGTVAFISSIPDEERQHWVPNPARAAFTAYAQDGRVLGTATGH